MTDFETWFEINKVTSNRKSDMEGLKDLFEKCWNDSQNKCLENSNENLKDRVDELEYDIENFKDDIENLKGIMKLRNPKH